MAEVIADYGQLAGLCGHDGDGWLKALIDAAGHLQIDLVDSGGANLGDLKTLLTEIQARMGDESAPAAGTVNKQLADILTATEKIDDLRNALDSVDTDELVVNVDESVLPTGAATSANQSTIIAAIEKIDDLQATLESVGTDTLRAGLCYWDGSEWQKLALEKIAGFESQVLIRESNLEATAGGNTLDSSAVPTGKAWVITGGVAFDETNAPSLVAIGIYDGTNNHWVAQEVSPAAKEPAAISNDMLLIAGDKVRAYFEGCTLNDDLWLMAVGHQMDAP